MPVDKVIVLNTLRYQEEIQPHPDVVAAAARKAGAGGKELQMALKLVEEMSEAWKPDVFTDTYRDDLMKRIEEKVKAGQTHALTAPEKEAGEERATGGGKVVDLMSLLQRSLDQKGRSGGATEPAARATKRKHAAARRRTTSARPARRA
jgi:DNA end-binding protein Ku